MSPAVWTLAIAIIAFSPFAAATPAHHGDGFEPCAASCIVTTTVTQTVTELACSAFSSVVGTTLVNATSTSLPGHHGHHGHHHNSTIASLPMSSTNTGELTSSGEPASTSLSTHHHRHHHLTNSFITASTTSAASSTSTLAAPANDCQHDNCLRQFIRSPEVNGFCATYTMELNSATTGLPDFVSQCQAEPSRVSSACSCIATKGSPTAPTSTSAPPANDCHADNCLRQFIRYPEVTGFCASYTTEDNIATTGLPDYVSQCQAEPSRISSACSCIMTDVSPASTTAAATTETDDGTYTGATTSAPIPAQTSIYTQTDVCPLTSIFLDTTTLTMTFVSTITLHEVSTSAASTTTSSKSELTTTLAASSSSEMSLTTSSVREHRHRHGGH